MNLIPNIVLNENELKNIITYGRFATGGEAVICKGNNPNTLYKIFEERGIPKPMGENKQKKIIELYNKQIDYAVKPLSTISLNNIIVGYEMTEDYDFKSYKTYELKKDELIYFLKETKKILEYFTNKEIIYGDLEPRNILFNKNTGEIKFCDMDNIHIKNYTFDKLPNPLIEYENMRGIDYGINPYMHNLMTLRAFDLDIYFNIMSSLRKLVNKKGRKILKSMINPLDFKDEYIVEHIKK